MRAETRSESETEALARALADGLEGPVVLGLTGPLGAGKTCFTRGVAEGLGVDPRQIASPTFVYLVEYPAASTRLVHADLYRMGEGGLELGELAFDSVGLGEALFGDAVTVVEWWQYYRGPMPQRVISVEFEPGSGENRKIDLAFTGPELDAPAGRAADWLARSRAKR